MQGVGMSGPKPGKLALPQRVNPCSKVGGKMKHSTLTLVIRRLATKARECEREASDLLQCKTKYPEMIYPWDAHAAQWAQMGSKCRAKIEQLCEKYS